MDIKLIDSNFAHATSCSNGDLKIFPKYFNWYRGNEYRDITVFVDAQGSRAPFIESKIKIWMLLEPPTISPQMYTAAKLQSIQDHFDYILTFDKSLCSLNKKFIWYPLGGCWIEPQDRQIYPKTKNISIIASEKNYTEGHKLRHEIIHRFGNKIDVFGRGYKYIPSKLEALKDYRYTIVIENCKLNDYFSEKLIDPMVTGTIPIYWGSRILENFYNGVIYPIENLDNLISNKNIEILYNNFSNDGFIYKNFELAKQFVNTEDWLWENFFKQLCTTILNQ